MNEDEVSLAARLKSWEKLRVLYNSIMLLAGIPALKSIQWVLHQLPPRQVGMMGIQLTLDSLVLFTIAFGIFANLLYFLGPAAEIYIIAFTGKRFSRTARHVAFSLGLLFSLAVQAGIVLQLQSLVW
jgi:hypothetical protein